MSLYTGVFFVTLDAIVTWMDQESERGRTFFVASALEARGTRDGKKRKERERERESAKARGANHMPMYHSIPP